MSVTVERMSGSSSTMSTGPLFLADGLSLSLPYCIQRRSGWGRGRRAGGKDHVEDAPTLRMGAVASSPLSAFHPDSSAVLLGDAPADKEAEAHSGEAAVVDVCSSVEALKDIWQVLLRYAYTP